MGTLHYDGVEIRFDDEVLAHLETVIVNKLRRREGFVLSWRQPTIGRSTVWLDPSIPLRFEYDSEEAPHLERDWVESLMVSANGSGGLVVTDRQGEPLRAELVVSV
ncbi:DUF7882 family protein [Leifsonia sp. AG29]|uniref:DUF7882 family protein n=1 Tax=Leifsonia sp. AG29 TaxID=2598860 RepID=UPI00131BBB8A|nr:ATP-dependent DNA ligase [Leifsonia sp. AG29]